uniref:Uncharacterized protein n=1 Tax=Anopheles atroparvus TaxID=41427 RepID=A0AAG5DAV3_ANOAO
MQNTFLDAMVNGQTGYDKHDSWSTQCRSPNATEYGTRGSQSLGWRVAVGVIF